MIYKLVSNSGLAPKRGSLMGGGRAAAIDCGIAAARAKLPECSAIRSLADTIYWELSMAVALEDERRLAIVANVERLILDAHTLLDHGSAGSALATAILAFEEAGKGHRLELNLEKTKRTPSWHHFRQVVSAFVLFASAFQKYGLQPPQLDQNARKLIEERWSGNKRLDELTNEPVPKEFQDAVVDAVIPGLDALTADQCTILMAEVRWIKKVFLAAASGLVEKERQSGMYVDITEGGVVSDPAAIRKERAYYWIRVAERTLKILRDGEYSEPYGELSAYLEAQTKPLPQGDALLTALETLQAEAADRIADLRLTETERTV
jgi:AbiV family abortive infection protein